MFFRGPGLAGSVGTVVPRADGPQAPPAGPPAPARAQAAAPAATPAAPTPSIVAATVKDYCAACHNERTKTGGLVLTNLDPANVPADAEIWEKVIRKVRTGMMPPPGVRHPDPKERSTFVASLASTLDRAAAAKPNPGRPALYRLNRTEHANAVRDLLDLEVDATTLLPPDDSAYGFDNVADALSVSSTLMEQYVSAAGKVSARSRSAAPTSVRRRRSSTCVRTRRRTGTSRDCRSVPSAAFWRGRSSRSRASTAVGEVLPHQPRRDASGLEHRAPLGVLGGRKRACTCSRSVEPRTGPRTWRTTRSSPIKSRSGQGEGAPDGWAARDHGRLAQEERNHRSRCGRRGRSVVHMTRATRSGFRIS